MDAGDPGITADSGLVRSDGGLVRSDEFVADELDLGDRTVAKGNRKFDGWGNAELRHYQDENLTVDYLRIDK